MPCKGCIAFDFNLNLYNIIWMSQELQLKVILKCLDNVKRKEQQQQQKERIEAVIKRVQNSRDKKDLKPLNAVHTKMLNLLIDGFNAFKEAFHELSKAEKYRIIDATSIDISDFLLSIQPNINVSKDNLLVDNLVAKYTVNILKLKKLHEEWPKEFFAEWSAKSKDKMKKIESKRLEPPPKPEPRQVVDKYSESDDNQSEEIRPTKPAMRQQRQVKKEVIIEKPRRVEQTKPDLRNENTKQGKNRVNAMERYLQHRKDLGFDRNKTRDIAQFLTSRFDNFMKKAIERVIDISSLKNKRNPKFGNEVGYFATENERVTHQTPFYISPNSKVFVLMYKHKLEVYTTLRSKQLKKEDELRIALEAKTNESEKKIDKKIQSYILKPRPKEVQPIEIFREDKEPMRNNPNNLVINADHVLYFLEQHHFLRNSLLLFNAYHY